MGQRLIILNTIDGEDVNVLYYHWGAYTDSALSIVGMLRDSIVEEFNKLPKDMDRKTRFNIASMRSASGVSTNHSESYEYISKYLTKSEIEDKLRGSRNEGLIAFTEADRDDLLGWSEGTVPIEWKFDEDGNIDVEILHLALSCYYLCTPKNNGSSTSKTMPRIHGQRWRPNRSQ